MKVQEGLMLTEEMLFLFQKWNQFFNGCNFLAYIIVCCKFCHMVQCYIICMAEHTELINKIMQDLGQLCSNKSR